METGCMVTALLCALIAYELLVHKFSKQRASLIIPVARIWRRILNARKRTLCIAEQAAHEPDTRNDEFKALLETLGIDQPICSSDITHPPATLREKAADIAATFCGSWTFIFLYVAFTAIWCVGNSFWWSFDRYPFFFITFSINVFSIIMCSLLLLASNREAALDRAEARNAYQQTGQLWTMLVHALLTLKRQGKTLRSLVAEVSAEHALLEKKIDKLDARMAVIEGLLRQLLDDSH